MPLGHKVGFSGVLSTLIQVVLFLVDPDPPGGVRIMGDLLDPNRISMDDADPGC